MWLVTLPRWGDFRGPVCHEVGLRVNCGYEEGHLHTRTSARLAPRRQGCLGHPRSDSRGSRRDADGALGGDDATYVPLGRGGGSHPRGGLAGATGAGRGEGLSAVRYGRP